MRLFSRLLLPTLCATFTVFSAPVAAQDSGAKSVDAAWMKAMKANDLEGVMACYAPDAVLWMPDAPAARGAQAIRAAFEGLFKANTVKDVTMTDGYYKTSGDLSFGSGQFTMTLVPKAGGAPMVLKGRFSEAAERRGGKWVYVVDHAALDPQPSPPARRPVP